MTTENGSCYCKCPLACLRSDSDEKFALLLLNTPLQSIQKLFTRLWNTATYRACVDGGLNGLYTLASSSHKLSNPRPDLITGDFDSVQPDVLQYYQQQGCEVVNTIDQDNSDFTKCIRLVSEKFQKDKCQLDYIVVVVREGGRFDHLLGNINTLFLAQQWTTLPIYLVSGGGLTTLLPQGKHTLLTNSGFEGETCGLLPIGGPCPNVTTTGLKWNLNNQTLEFGALISSSNTYDTSNNGVVTIETEVPIVWTMDHIL